MGCYALASETKIENFSIYSSFRFHPIITYPQLYFQTGLGIYRTNPVALFTEKYSYKSFLTNRLGANIYFNKKVFIQPEIDWLLIMDRASSISSELVGLNQFDFNLIFGYTF